VQPNAPFHWLLAIGAGFAGRLAGKPPGGWWPAFADSGIQLWEKGRHSCPPSEELDPGIAVAPRASPNGPTCHLLRRRVYVS